MKDEPGQWARDTPDAPAVSAQGVDLFTTWLVSTTTDSPAAENDVRFLYYWNWTISWTSSTCTVDSYGQGRGPHTPTLKGEGARKRYNDFLASKPKRPSSRDTFEEKMDLLKAGIQNQVAKTELSKLIGEMREAWKDMGEGERGPLRLRTIMALDEYVYQVQRYRPAQAALGQIFGFADLTPKHWIL